MATDLDKGIDTWYQITKTLNGIIRDDGWITINDKRIWSEYLHKWDNDDWGLLLVAMDELLAQYPWLFKKFHIDAYNDLRDTLMEECDTHNRCIDQKRNKIKAWKMIMALREVWNECCGIDLPNRPPSKYGKSTPVSVPVKTKAKDQSQFKALFE